MKKLFTILKYIKNYKKFVFFHIISTFFSVIFNIFSLTLVIPFLQILFGGDDKLIHQQPAFALNIKSLTENLYYYISQIIINYGKEYALVFICILVLVSVFLKNVFLYLAQYFVAPVRSGVMRDLRRDLYERVIQLPLLYFSEKRKGDIISRMTNDVQEIEWAVMSSITIIFREPLTILFSLGIMIFMSYQLSIFVFILLPLAGLIIGRVGKSLKRTSVKGQIKIGQLTSLIEETLSGIRIIKAFCAHAFCNDRFRKANDSYMQIFTRMTRKRDLSSPLSEFLSIAVVCIVIWFGGRLVLKGSIGAEMFIAYIVIFSQIIAPAKSFSTGYYNIQKGNASIDRINAILNEEIKITEKPNAISVSSFNDKIEFKNVHFSYDSEPVLNNINLIVEKGKTIAVVGSSGAGKSTMIDLLPRFYDIIAGDILLDGISIKDYVIPDLRNLMGIVTQESILFNDTIANNIAFGYTNIPREQIIEAAKVANAHNFIMESKEGYDFVIGDRGTRLSGGQKQRITIARAVLKNPPILLLDEATSSLDTESEQLVQEALSNLMKNRTTIVIAHRLSTIQHADEIVVLQKGEIIERGKHLQLIEKNGVYRKLYEMQSFS